MGNCIACGQDSNDLTTVHQEVPGQIALEELTYCPPCHETIIVQSTTTEGDPADVASELLSE